MNDGSTDSCKEICEEYKNKDSRIKVIHQQNQGSGFARNNGLALAKGKFIYFCDPDDYVLPNLLSENISLAEKYDANLVIFGYYNIIKKNKVRELSAKSMFLESKESFRNEFGQLFQIQIMYTLWNKIYRKEFLEKNNCVFSNQKVGQDTMFNYKVYENLDKVYVNDNKYYYYVMKRNGSATNSFKVDKFDIRYQETIALENLLTNWGYKNKYNHLIMEDWIATLFLGMNNLFNDQSPYSQYEKKEQLKKIVQTPKIRDQLYNFDITKLKFSLKYVLIYLLKKNYIKSVFLLMKAKRSIKG